LALYCRAENNRVYLEKGIKLRPGYLAKWIEFKTLDANGDESYRQQIKAQGAGKKKKRRNHDELKMNKEEGKKSRNPEDKAF
jgi:hypothetical protein